MSYQIQYSPEFKKQYPAKVKHKHSLLPIIILSVALLLVYAATQTRAINVLLPGSETVTTAAFSGLVNNVQSGISVRESLLMFCREIIISGK